MRRRIVTKLMVAMAPAVLVAVVAGCAPGPGAAAGGPVEPSRGCHDHLGPGKPDVEYSGEPSEYGNLRFWTSTDGSCRGGVVAGTVAATTLMIAPDAANAEFLCRNLLGSPVLAGTFEERTGPWAPSFGALGFSCAG